MTTRPSIDHGFLSPSGRVSKRARKAAQEQTRRELFGDGLPYPTCKQPTERERLLRHAARLRDLAERGMSPRAFIKDAEMLEKKAADLA